MRTAPFGYTGVPVPIIGQGTWMIEGEAAREQQAVEALRAGLELGLTHIDTAEMYGSGRSEQVVGRAIAGRRDRVFLVSKVLPSNASYDGTLRACEASLHRLGTEHLDLYLLHWEGRHPISETMRAMEQLVARGLTRFIGVSNFDVPQVKAAQHALKNERLAANQVLYHLGDRGIERKLIPYCTEQGIAVVGYSPFGSGGGFPKSRALAEIAKRNGLTERQCVLQFLTRKGVFTIPKSGSAPHTRENAGALDKVLPDAELAALDRAFPAPTRDVPLGMI